MSSNLSQSFFQSKKIQGFCFTEFTTVSMLTIILSQSNVLNSVAVFLLSQRKPKAFVSQMLQLYQYSQFFFHYKMFSTLSQSPFSVKENPRLLFHRIDDCIYVDNYSFTIKCPQLCLHLFPQSKKSQGFCFTECTTLSMLTIIFSQSNVLNSV